MIYFYHYTSIIYIKISCFCKKKTPDKIWFYFYWSIFYTNISMKNKFYILLLFTSTLVVFHEVEIAKISYSSKREKNTRFSTVFLPFDMHARYNGKNVWKKTSLKNRWSCWSILRRKLVWFCKERSTTLNIKNACNSANWNCVARKCQFTFAI